MSNEDVKLFFNKNAQEYSRQLNKYVMDIRANFIRKYARGKILDIGIGPGTLANKYSQCNNVIDVIGLDISINLLNIAAKGNNFKVILVNGDGEELPFKSESFDTLICSELIYYLEHPLNLLNESRRVLKAGGHIIILFPSKLYCFFNPIVSFLKLQPREDIKKRSCSSSELKMFLNKASLIPIHDKGIPVIPYSFFNFLDRTLLEKIVPIKCIVAVKG